LIVGIKVNTDPSGCWYTSEERIQGKASSWIRKHQWNNAVWHTVLLPLVVNMLVALSHMSIISFANLYYSGCFLDNWSGDVPDWRMWNESDNLALLDAQGKMEQCTTLRLIYDPRPQYSIQYTPQTIRFSYIIHQMWYPTASQ
jgi:hypothetical protein